MSKQSLFEELANELIKQKVEELVDVLSGVGAGSGRGVLATKDFSSVYTITWEQSDSVETAEERPLADAPTSELEALLKGLRAVREIENANAKDTDTTFGVLAGKRPVSDLIDALRKAHEEGRL